jgi:hypothetical protein
MKGILRLARANHCSAMGYAPQSGAVGGSVLDQINFIWD